MPLNAMAPTPLHHHNGFGASVPDNAYPASTIADTFNAIPYHDAQFRMGLKSFDDLSQPRLENLFGPPTSMDSSSDVHMGAADEGVQRAQSMGQLDAHMQDASDSFEGAAPMNLIQHDYNYNGNANDVFMQQMPSEPRGESSQHQSPKQQQGPRYEYPALGQLQSIEGELEYFDNTGDVEPFPEFAYENSASMDCFSTEGEIYSDATDPEFEYDFSTMMATSPQKQQNDMELFENLLSNQQAVEDVLFGEAGSSSAFDGEIDTSDYKSDGQNNKWQSREELAAVWARAAELFAQNPNANPNTFAPQLPQQSYGQVYPQQQPRTTPFQPATSGLIPASKQQFQVQSQFPPTNSFPTPKRERKTKVHGTPPPHTHFNPNIPPLSFGAQNQTMFAGHDYAIPRSLHSGNNSNEDLALQFVNHPQLKMPEVVPTQPWNPPSSGSVTSDYTQDDVDMQPAKEQEDHTDLVPLDPNDLVGAYTREERFHKIHKYMQGRKDRVYGKRVRYHSRKRFADNRPRIGGRFVKIKKDKSSPTEVAKVPNKDKGVAAMDMSG